MAQVLTYKTTAHTHTNARCWCVENQMQSRQQLNAMEIVCKYSTFCETHIGANQLKLPTVGLATQRTNTEKEKRKKEYDEMTFFLSDSFLSKSSWNWSTVVGQRVAFKWRQQRNGKTISWSHSMASSIESLHMNIYSIQWNGTAGAHSNGMQLQKWKKLKWHRFLCNESRLRSFSICFYVYFFFFNLFSLWKTHFLIVKPDANERCN